jgi:hypothetical protein
MIHVFWILIIMFDMFDMFWDVFRMIIPVGLFIDLQMIIPVGHSETFSQIPKSSPYPPHPMPPSPRMGWVAWWGLDLGICFRVALI